MAGRREPMKVIIINTKYVETDATSFKSVVQDLTGKDSRVMGNPPKEARSRFYKEQINKKDEGIPPAAGDSTLTKNLSFKEFEGLLKDMPPLDDLL